MFADGVLSFGGGDHPCHTNEQKSFEKSFEEIVGIDDPEAMDLIDGCVKFEEQVGQNLEVVADSVYFLQAYFRVSESWQQEVVGIVHFLMEIGCWFEVVSPFGGFLVGYFPEKIQADLSFLLLEAVTLFDEDVILPFDLFVEMYIFEIFAEEFAHDIIIDVILGEVFDNFFALVQIVLGI